MGFIIDAPDLGVCSYRGAVKLDLHCPQRVDGIAADPEPDWSFDALVSELNALEMKLTASFTSPFPTKTISRYYILSFSYMDLSL